FQAEDGIRDLIVTGVQTCALPTFGPQASLHRSRQLARDREAEAYTAGRGGPRGVRAVEAIEHAVRVWTVRPDGIGDHGLHGRSAQLRDQLDGRALRCVLDGVVEQVVEDLMQVL